MDPNQKIENTGEVTADGESDGSVSVDDFIKQLEEKEKDLHITADTKIEITDSFDDANMPDFLTGDLQIETFEPAVAVAASTAKSKGGKPANAKLEQEVVGLRDTVSQMQTERDEMVEIANRRAKDFENFKSRTERERKETFQSQLGNLATQMLPALDNLNRAMDFAFAMPEELRAEIQPFLDGVALINQQVNDVLAEMGVQPIATVGEVFDPHFHEAVATDDSEDLEPNTISAELLRGYRIGGRVIRHSMVKVVHGSPLPESEFAGDLEDDEAEEMYEIWAEEIAAEDPLADLTDPESTPLR